jgi:hypothetical protein
MKKNLLCTRASALIVLTAAMVLAGCPTNTENIENAENTEPVEPTDDLDIFAVDISQETDWNYMVVGKDGSSIFFTADESTGIPTLLYLKPDKDSDAGFTYLFKENGLPDKMIANGYVLYFGNFSGYKFDIAIIYPDSTIKYHYDIETDINWDAYNEISRSARAIIPDWISNALDIAGHAIGVATCVASPFFPPAAAGCASYVATTVGSILIDQVFDGFTADAGNAIIKVIGCAGGGVSGAIDCISGIVDAVDLLTYVDLDFADQKTTQINEAIRKIDGDALTTTIPRELLEYFLSLGIEVNSGRNPPNIEGTYRATPLQLVKTTTGTGISDQWDMYVTFSGQNDARLTVDTNYLIQSDTGPMTSGGTASFIVGEGGRFTVFQEGTREESGYTAKTVEVFSGEAADTGIRNYQWAVFMVDNRGDPLGHWIADGTGYFKRDSDRFSEKIYPVDLNQLLGSFTVLADGDSGAIYGQNRSMLPSEVLLTEDNLRRH